MKTIFKAATIALILCAILMSGCLDSGDDSVVDTVGETGVMSDESTSDVGAAGDVPFTVTVIMTEEGSPDSYSIFFIFKEDGAAEYGMIGKGGDFCVPGTWRQGSSDNEYVLISPDGRDDGDTYVTILDNGVATIECEREDEDLVGTWEAGASR